MILCYFNSLQLVSKQAWMTFELQFWVIFLVSRFLVMEAIFLGGFFHLVFILGFQARLRLETCREYCLEQNPSIFVIFGAHLMILKNRACLVLAIMRFLCIFLGLDWRIDVWGWKSMYFCWKIRKIFGEIFFFFSRTRACSAGGEDEQTPYWRHHDIIKKKNKFFFWLPWYSWIDYAYVRIVMHLLNLTLLGQLL